MHSRPKLVLGFLLAALSAASMWFYVDCILVPYQVADAAAHHRPRGNLSDLYPRWLGARELLLRHRNPYSEDITKEIQQGYYGRVLDPSRPNDPKDEQAFAYPVYVVFLLAPLIGFPFHAVRIFFYWLLVALTAASVCWWLRALGWRVTIPGFSICTALTLGCFPAVQGVKLQQLSLLVAALLAASAACLASGLLACSGVLLALATIKPQLAWPFGAWMLLWVANDWRTRRSFVFGFAMAMAWLLVGAEVVLPGWPLMFAHALGQYHRYTQNQSVLDLLVPWGFSGKILAAIVVFLTAIFLWKIRVHPADSIEFSRAIALLMALTVLVVPMYSPYNQVLLLPAILLLARDRALLLPSSRILHFGYLAGIFALAWQWIASLILTGAFLIGWQQWAFLRRWWPGLATFALPVVVFALTLLDLRNAHRAAPTVPQDQAVH